MKGTAAACYRQPAVWLYYRFPLSYRDVEEMLLQWGIPVSYQSRAVDQDGEVIDILLQSRRNKRAARKFFRKRLKRQGYVARVLVTDKLKSYGAAQKEVLKSVEHHITGFIWSL